MKTIGIVAMMLNRRLAMALAGAVVWVLAPGPAIGAVFAAPNDGPVPFRRDRIPLEQGAMVDLSKALGVLARGLNPKTGRSGAGRRR